jgi:hypothetical protein
VHGWRTSREACYEGNAQPMDKVFIYDFFAFLQEVFGLDLLSPVWLRPAAGVGKTSCRF